MADDVLDRPIWNALSGRQRAFAAGSGAALRFDPAVAPFADTPGDDLAGLHAVLAPGEAAALFTRTELEPPAGLVVARRAAIMQMVLDGPVRAPPGGPYRSLSGADAPAMLALVEDTRPGPFGPRTVELGGYLAVEDAGTLVAMAGERLKPAGCVEISAVCVRPSHRGRGLAAGLVAAVSAAVLARGELPFLHVFASNIVAVALYERLGFVQRCPMHLLVLHNPAEPGA